jgi:transcriptional regulator with XRE-family HTH domain
MKKKITIEIVEAPLLEIGQAIRKTREEKGLKLYDITRLTGMDNGYYSRLEKGAIKNPGINTIMLIAEALEVDICDLINLAKKMSRKINDSAFKRIKKRGTIPT